MLLLAAGDTLQGLATVGAKVTYTVIGMELNAGVETYKVLAQGQLAVAAGTLYTAPVGTTAFIKSISLVNTDFSNSISFTLYRGGSAGTNQLTPLFALPVSGMAIYEDGDGWQFLDISGQLLQRPAVSPSLSAVLTADTANQTSTTEAIVSQVLTIPANYLQSGSSIEFDLFFTGAQGATAQTTPGILFQLRYGGLAGTLIASVGTITPATLLAATAGYLRGLITFTAVGAGGAVRAGMIVTDPRGTRVAAGDMASKVGQATAVAVDTTTAKDLVITCKSTIADASCITVGKTGSSFLERY